MSSLTAEERKVLMAERRKNFDEDNRKEQERVAAEKHSALMAKWEPGLVGARKTNELNVSWQGFTALIPEIFEFKNLISLRLVGNTLPTLPEELFTGLPKLQVLFLTANHLTALPENIGKCITLRELNIMKNDVQVLPDSICDLVNIESLEMSNNKLTTLPRRFGNLQKLPRLVLEKNLLEELPESFGSLKLEVLNISSNKFKELSNAVCGITSLRSLFVNNNEIENLPKDIGKLANLTTLQVCNNKLLELPKNICNLAKLERLWLDWNQIKMLPLEFPQLKKLEQLKMEQNPLIVPSIDIVYQGVSAVMQWCTNKVESMRRANRRGVCINVQKLLATVYAHTLSDDSHFRAEVKWINGDGIDEDYFAFPSLQYFFDTLIPLVSKYWKENENLKQFWDFEPDEVEDALLNYTDAYGKIMEQNQKIKFLRCSCVNEKGKKRVCVPPDDKFMCERSACIIKMNLITAEMKREKDVKHAEEVALAEALKAATDKVMAFVNSQEGIDELESRAVEAATNDMEEERKKQFLKVHMGTVDKQHKKKLEALNHERDKLKKARAKRVEALKVKKKKLEEKSKRLKGWQLDAAVEELEDFDDQINHTVEDDKMIICDEDEKEIEEWYQAEVDKVMVGYKPRGDMQKELDAQSSHFAELKRQRFFQFRDETIEGELAEAKEEVEHEYAVYRRIANNWVGMNLRTIFETWRDHVRETVDEREYLEEEDAEKRALAEEGKEAEKVLRATEKAKWIEKWDDYQDRTYFEHSETGEIVYDERPDRDFISRTIKK